MPKNHLEHHQPSKTLVPDDETSGIKALPGREEPSDEEMFGSHDERVRRVEQKAKRRILKSLTLEKELLEEILALKAKRGERSEVYHEMKKEYVQRFGTLDKRTGQVLYAPHDLEARLEEVKAKIGELNASASPDSEDAASG